MRSHLLRGVVFLCGSQFLTAFDDAFSNVWMYYLVNDFRGSSSVVERLLAKEEVAGSTPVFRSNSTELASRW